MKKSLLFLLIAGCGTQSDGTKKTASTTSPPTVATPDTGRGQVVQKAAPVDESVVTESDVGIIYNAYEENPAAATIKYGGKVVEFVMAVEKIESKDGRFILKQANALQGNSSIPAIDVKHTAVSFDNAEAVAHVKTGKKYTVRGRVEKFERKKLIISGVSVSP